jgi:hypothetical protein
MTPAESRMQAEREGAQERAEQLERLGLPPDYWDAELAILRGHAHVQPLPAPETLQ